MTMIRYAGGGTGQAKREEGLVRPPPQAESVLL